jgi:hypothetical protein
MDRREKGGKPLTGFAESVDRSALPPSLLLAGGEETAEPGTQKPGDLEALEPLNPPFGGQPGASKQAVWLPSPARFT